MSRDELAAALTEVAEGRIPKVPTPGPTQAPHLSYTFGTYMPPETTSRSNSVRALQVEALC